VEKLHFRGEAGMSLSSEYLCDAQYFLMSASCFSNPDPSCPAQSTHKKHRGTRQLILTHKTLLYTIIQTIYWWFKHIWTLNV